MTRIFATFSLLAGVSGCLQPAWVDSWPCEGDEVHHVDDFAGVDECIEIPPECEAVFADECDLRALDDTCRAVLCEGFEGGNYDQRVSCWGANGTRYRFAECD